MMIHNKLNFLIADDHNIVVQGLSLIIKDTFENPTIYTANNFKETLENLIDYPIDILILDVVFPEGMSTLIVKEIKALKPNVKILIFSIYDEEIYASEYINLGATGFLNKTSNEEQIKTALLSIIDNGTFPSHLLNESISQPNNPFDQLSSRETEIIRLIIKGYSNQEISKAIAINQSTTSTHKNRIFAKLNISNLSELIQLYNLHLNKDYMY